MLCSVVICCSIVVCRSIQCILNFRDRFALFCPLSGQLQLWQVQTVHWRHDNRNWLPAKEEYRLVPLRLRQDGCRVYPAVQQPGLLCHPAGLYSEDTLGFCSSLSLCCFDQLFSVFQLVFSFCDKLFGLMVKDIEAMDASILKGEPATGKKQKVLGRMLKDKAEIIALLILKCTDIWFPSKTGINSQ